MSNSETNEQGALNTETPNETVEQSEAGTPEDGNTGAPVDFGALLKDKGFQAELGRYVNKALGTAKTKWEKEALERINTAKTEGEKLAKLSAEERAKVEAEQRVADILSREEQMNAREAEIMRRELRAEALSTLEQRGLPTGLAEATGLGYKPINTALTPLTILEELDAIVNNGVKMRKNSG